MKFANPHQVIRGDARMSAFGTKRTLATFPPGGFRSACSVHYHDRDGLGVAMKRRNAFWRRGSSVAVRGQRTDGSYLIGLN
jgi:hypothetical protein